MSDLSKSENEIYSLRKEKEQKIKDSKLESFQTSFKNSTPIDFLHREHKHFDEVLNSCYPSGIALGSILHYRSKNFPTKGKDGNVNFLMQQKNYIDFGNYSIRDIKNHLRNKANLR